MDIDFSAYLNDVASSPGVYLMKDAAGEIIYVGKAKNLRKRLSSYFQQQRTDSLKTRMLVQKIVALDTIVTESENEALILESNLIKKHRPRYNVVLKDDKRYPALRLRTHVPYPNIEVVRKMRKDGSLYFGPYTSATAMRQTLKIINKHFKIRKCKDSVFKSRTRPCLFHQIGACLGPCCLEVDPKIYEDILQEIILFLKGRTLDLLRKVEAEMNAAAEAENYERAAELRDKRNALERVIEQQIAIAQDQGDRDVIGLARGPHKDMITVLSVRNGYLNGSTSYAFRDVLDEDSRMIAGFIRQFYEVNREIPKEILVPCDMSEEAEILEAWLGEGRGRVFIRFPRRGEKARLIRMANQNASQELEQQTSADRTSQDLLERMQARLHLNRLPERIECVDNSNLSGQQPVSGIVAYENGKPLKSAYRRYKIRSVAIQNDYAYMEEILRRRFGKGPASEPFPDLLMLDGGKGQLSIARSVLEELGVWGKFDVIGIAKKDPVRGETDDKIYQHGRSNPLSIGKDRDILGLLQVIRDESHRFAVSFHRSCRQRSGLFSALDDVPGIGKTRKAALIRHFGSIKRIRAATREELEAVPGISHELASAIRHALNPQ